MFKVNTYKKRFDANKVTVLDKGKYPYVVRMSTNNGQKGFINEDISYLNEGNTLSFGQDTATVFYQEKPYFTGDKVKILKSKSEAFNRYSALFCLSAITKSFSNFSWGNSSYKSELIECQRLSLPAQDNKNIDLNFMEEFIAKIERQRINKLETYLVKNGFNNSFLSDEEKQAIDDFKNGDIEFKDFSYKSVFNRIKQGRRLKKDDQIAGNIPFVMAGVTNTGVVDYISNPVAKFPKNSITVDIFGNTFYRNYDYGAGDDTGVYWHDKEEYSKETILFIAASMQKSILGKFDYGTKLRSSKSVNFKMQLPSKGEKPDFEYMNTLISAIQKLVIKKVVVYVEEKLEKQA